VNGQRIKDDFDLRHDHRIMFGFAFCFRVLIPAAGDDEDEEPSLAFGKATKSVTSSSNEDDFERLAFVWEIQNRFGQTRAQAFIHEFKRVVAHIEEANTITHEIRPDECLRFSVETVSDIYHYQEQVPTCVIRLKQFEKGAQRLRNFIRREVIPTPNMTVAKLTAMLLEPDHFRGKRFVTLALYDIATFKQVLVHLREVSEVFHREGKDVFDYAKVGHDPGRLMHPWECAELLEDASQHWEERTASLEQRLEQMMKDSRTFQQLCKKKDARIQDLELEVQVLRCEAARQCCGSDDGASSPGGSRLVSVERSFQKGGEELLSATSRASALLDGLEAVKRQLQVHGVQRMVCS
jgi:hypothetical protein